MNQMWFCDFTMTRYGDIDKTCRLFKRLHWKPVYRLTDGNFFEKFCKRIQFQCYVTWMISENAHYRVAVYSKKSKRYRIVDDRFFSWKISVYSVSEKNKTFEMNDQSNIMDSMIVYMDSDADCYDNACFSSTNSIFDRHRLSWTSSKNFHQINSLIHFADCDSNEI